MMSLPPYGIITKGLGLPACRGLITGYFYLGICKVQVIIPLPSGSVTGGSIALRPGEIKDLFKPVQPNKTNYAKRETVDVILKLTFKNEIYTSVYHVRPSYANIIAKIINISNITVDKIKVTVTSLRERTNDVTAKVTRLLTKKDYINPIVTKIENDDNNS